jgi:hypothetical protein
MSNYFVGDVGTPIVLDVGADIYDAVSMHMVVRKPSGKTVEWEATLGPVNSIGQYTTIMYVTQEGDWDEPGVWKIQAYIELPTWSGHGDVVTFKLDQPLENQD